MNLFKLIILTSSVLTLIFAQQIANSVFPMASLPQLPMAPLPQLPSFPMAPMPHFPMPPVPTFPRFPTPGAIPTVAPLPMPTFHTLPPFTPPPPIPFTPVPPARAMAPVQVRYDPSPPRRRVNYQNPNFAWREIPKDRVYQSPDRYQPINFFHPSSIDQNVGYENDIGHIWYLCTTGNCGRGKK